MPPQAAADVLATCVSGVADPALQLRLQAIMPQLVAAAANYDQLARVQSLHQLVRAPNVGAVTRPELEELYTQQMSATVQGGDKPGQWSVGFVLMRAE